MRPLDGTKASANDQDDFVRFEWEGVSSSAQQVEFLGLAEVGQSIFALGMQKPPAGEKRAGSYLARVNAGTSIEVLHSNPELAPSSLVPIDDELGVFGFLPADHGSSAVFRLLDKNAREKWRYVENGDHWNFPISAVKSATGYIFLSSESGSVATPPALVITQVSATGGATMQRRYPLPISVGAHGPKNVIIEPNGTLTVALPGHLITKPAAQLPMWTNPKTGSKSFCVDNNHATVLLSIDPGTLDLRTQKIIENDQVVSMRQRDGHLYAAVNFSTNCSLNTNIKLVEISPAFELRTIFETRNVNSLEVTDLVATSEHFVLVGKLHTFLPTSSTRETLNTEKLAADVWNDSFWERNEDQLSAFVLVVAADGSYVSDRVFSGVAHRAISSLIALESGSFVAAGETFSARGWIMSFSLYETRAGLRDGVRLWLKGIWKTLGWNH